MSNPELIYLAPECHEEGERLWCEDDVWGSCREHDGEHCEESHPSVRYVRGDLHDALAQRCRELETENEDLVFALSDAEQRANNAGRNASAFEDRMGDLQVANGKLNDEIADLKARLLEAERGAEELVRLRAENRDIRALLSECRPAVAREVETWARVGFPRKSGLLQRLAESLEDLRDEG